MTNTANIVRASIARFIFAIILTIPFLWLNHTLTGQPMWSTALIIGAVLCAIDEQRWRRLPAFPGVLWRIIGFAVIVVLVAISTGTVTPQDSLSSVVYVITLLLLLGLLFLYQQSNAASKIAAIGFGLGMALLIAELGAGMILGQVERRAVAKQLTTQPTPQITEQAASTSFPTATIAASNTPLPTATAGASPTPTLTPTPAPTRPVAGMGFVDFSVDNGEPEWGPMTGYGPRRNSVARAYMYDNNGNLVYDTNLEFNGKGYRGPEVSYEKPDDTYRILIIGDSFVEAVQVAYEDTFQALLQKKLDNHATDKRRFEVIGMGRMGWGTLQEYIYYQVEGYKYNADLVILMFYINDVADNYPAFFYPGINNTNFEFVFENNSVKLVDTNRQAIPAKTGRILYNALPPFLQNTNIARLAVRLSDPPPQVVTPGGVLTRVHPQYYIYVTEPEVEGYDEGWRRTEWALTHFAQAANKNGSRFVVVPIFIGAEMVRNVSGWWPELVQGWQWDDTLPERKLSQILATQPATLIETRPLFEEYAREHGGEVYNLIFLPEDGHFNKLGHQLTKDVIFNWLNKEGIVSK